MKSPRLHNLVIAVSVYFICSTVHASLATDALLNFYSGVPEPSGDSSTQPISGSYIVWDFSSISDIDTNIFITIDQFNPIELGTIQSASGSHVGLPNGTESPGIDNPWSVFGNTGMHETVFPITILSDDNAGNVTLDFGGWWIEWLGVNVPLGGAEEFPEDTGIATMTCASSCENGDSYVLDYMAHVPSGNPSGFGGGLYALHLEGNISVIPIPAAAWLFGSGLLGLIGISRCKKAA